MPVGQFGTLIWARLMFGWAMACGDAVELTEDESYEPEVLG